MALAGVTACSRRTFLVRGLSATALAFAARARTRAASASIRSTQPGTFDIAVVGAGMFGSAAARHLSADAEGIALIGPEEPPSRRTHQGVFASHYDATRLMRIADPDLIWATLAKRSIGRFRAIERASGIGFYREIGYMMVTLGGLGTDWFDFPAMRAVADDLYVTVETLTAADLEERFPTLRFTPGSSALLQPSDAGLIDPRALVRAQQTIARAQGTTIIHAEVVELRRVGDQIEIRATSGEAFRANRVLVATGASTNACNLLGRPLDITVRAAMTMQAEVSPETRLAIPPILYAKTDGAAPFWGLLMPPVTYPDGRRYVKTMDDHYGSRALETYADLGAWSRGGGHQDHANVLQRALGEVAPSLDVRRTRFTPCPIADTATSYPYVDLERDLKQRLPEIGTARLDIDEAEAPDDSTAGPTSAETRPLTFWQRPVGMAVVALIALTIGGLGVWTVARPDAEPADVVRFEILPPDDAPMSVQLGPRDLTISPDGTLIVYDGVPPGENLPRLHIRRLDGTDAVALRGADLAMGPFVSPDGEWVGFISQPSPTTLRKISILGGQPLTVAESPSVILGTSWGRDDRIVFGTINSGLFRVAAGGGDPEPLTTLDPELGETSHSWPSVIPDRDAILFVISSGSALPTGQLAVLDLTNREVTRLGLAGVGPHYAPTGHLVYAAEDRSVRAAAFDVASLTVTGSPVPLVEEIIVKQDGTADFSISDGGTLLYTRSPANLGAATRTLAWVDRQGVREPLVGAPADSYASVTLSPGGTDVAMEIFDRSGAGVAAIWTFNLERGTFNRVTNEPGLSVSPLWTLDGRRLVYGSGSERGEGSGSLFWRNADGTGDPERLVAVDRAFSVSPWDWSPDGAWLLFRSRAGSQAPR